MIKKVLVSAAGRGSRMLHLSQDKPKHLIEINKKPFLYYLLSNLKEAGFEEIIMVVGYKKEFMDQFLEEYNEFNIKLINQFDILGEDKYGTACPIEVAMKEINDESFLAVYGDNLYSIEDLKRFNSDDDYSYVAGLPHERPENYGVLKVGSDGFLENIIEKPKDPVGNLINTGLYKFTPEVFEHINKIDLSPRGEYELTDVINLLAAKGRVKALDLKGVWLDLGKPEDVNKVEAYLKNNS